MQANTPTNHFFIRDCNDNIVGNPNGYRTIRGAHQQANGKYTKVSNQLWATFYAKRNNTPNCDPLVYSIKGAEA